MQRRGGGRGREVSRPSEIKAASPVVREEQNSADSSTSCILVRHLPHLEHDSSPSEAASHFFLVCTPEYLIVHLTFARGGARGRREDNRGRLYRSSRKRMRVTTAEFAPSGNFRLIESAAERLEAPLRSSRSRGETTPRVPRREDRRRRYSSIPQRPSSARI